jgi:hypothetical protein
LQNLPLQLERAKGSHAVVAVATGNFGSGRHKLWVTEWEADMSSIRSLAAEQLALETDYSSFSPEALEAKLIGVHTLQSRATNLRRRYDASVAADDKARDRITLAHTTAGRP